MIEETPFPPLPPEAQDPSVPWKPRSALARCESSGGHVVKPKMWPPTKQGRKEEPPSLSLQCQRCEGWLIVYDPPDPSIRVILPKPAHGPAIGSEKK